MDGQPSRTKQLIGSLIAAALIAAIAIGVVTARLGTTSVAELEAQEERRDQRLDAQEDRLKQQQELREERLEGD